MLINIMIRAASSRIFQCGTISKEYANIYEISEPVKVFTPAFTDLSIRNWNTYQAILEYNYCKWVNNPEDRINELRFLKAFNNAAEYLSHRKKKGIPVLITKDQQELLEKYCEQIGKSQPDIQLATDSKFISGKVLVATALTQEAEKIALAAEANKAFLKALRTSKEYEALKAYYDTRYSDKKTVHKNYRLFWIGPDLSVKRKGEVLGNLLTRLDTATTKKDVIDTLNKFYKSSPYQDTSEPTDYSILATGQGLLGWVLSKLGLKVPGSLDLMDKLDDKVIELNKGPR